MTVAVMQPPQRRGNTEQILDTIGKGLMIAQGIYGLKMDMAKFDDYKSNQDLMKRALDGDEEAIGKIKAGKNLAKADDELTQKDLSDAQAKGLRVVPEGTPGAQSYAMRGGKNVNLLLPEKIEKAPAAKLPDDDGLSQKELADLYSKGWKPGQGPEAIDLRLKGKSPITLIPPKPEEKMDPSARAAQVASSKTLDESRLRATSILQKTARIKDIIKKYGTNILTGPEGDEMDQKIYQIAVDYAKLNDPSSAAMAGEVQSAQDNLLRFRQLGGLRMTNESAVQLIESFEDSVNQNIENRIAGVTGGQPLVLAPKNRTGGIESTATAAPMKPLDKMSEAEIDAEIARLKKGR
jgi:hypothetical protein